MEGEGRTRSVLKGMESCLLKWDATNGRFYIDADEVSPGHEPRPRRHPEETKKKTRSSGRTSKLKHQLTMSRKKKRKQQVPQISDDKWERLLHPWQRELMAMSHAAKDSWREAEAKTEKVHKRTNGRKSRADKSGARRRRGSVEPGGSEETAREEGGNACCPKVTAAADPERAVAPRAEVADTPGADAVPGTAVEDIDPVVGAETSFAARGGDAFEGTNPADDDNDGGDDGSSDSEKDEMWAWVPEQGAVDGYDAGNGAVDLGTDDGTDGENDEIGWEWEPTSDKKPQTQPASRSREEGANSAVESSTSSRAMPETAEAPQPKGESVRLASSEDPSNAGSSGPTSLHSSVRELRASHAAERQTLTLAIDVERTRQRASLMRRRRRRPAPAPDSGSMPIMIAQ